MGRTCPTCKKPVKEEKHFPFCSERCRWVDLGHWLAEDYRVPVAEGPGAAGPGLEGGEEADGADGEGKEGPLPRPEGAS